MEMIIVRKPTPQELEKLGVGSWEIWTCKPSSFDWHYDDRETCYLLEGDVTVKTADQEVRFGVGDLVVFPKDLSCHWTVHKAVRKHYIFG